MAKERAEETERRADQERDHRAEQTQRQNKWARMVETVDKGEIELKTILLDLAELREERLRKGLILRKGAG